MGFEHLASIVDAPAALRLCSKNVSYGMNYALFLLPATDGRERFAEQRVLLMHLGESRECFNSTMRGFTMPAFTFEKISPPLRRGPVPSIEKKQRGVIVQILDRFVEARVKRAMPDENGVIARGPRKLPK
jgi:hypothetical protein